MDPVLATFCLLTPYLAILCYMDCRYRRLPNVMTLGGALVALAARYGAGGVACGLFLLLPFAMRAAGGGDVKMLAAVGCALGIGRVVETLLFTSVAGLLMMGVFLLFGNSDASRLRHLLRSMFDWRYDRKAGRAALPPKDSERCRVPFGVAIAVGAWSALLWEMWIG